MFLQEGHYSSSSAARVRCPAEDIVNPLNVFRIIANSELRKASEYYEAVQVKPQHVSLKLRISKRLFFTYPPTPPEKNAFKLIQKELQITVIAAGLLDPKKCSF